MNKDKLYLLIASIFGVLILFMLSFILPLLGLVFGIILYILICIGHNGIKEIENQER